MPMNTLTEQKPEKTQATYDLQQRRRSAVRTAWALAVLAVLIFTTFVLSGVMGN